MSKKRKIHHSLKFDLLKIIIIIYLLTSCFALVFMYYTLDSKINNLGTKFAIQYLHKEKNRIVNPIQQEIALAKKMVDTPILKRWAQNENDENLKQRAIASLESYRRHFQDKSYFFIVDESKRYYFNNQKDEFKNNQYRYTLEKDNSDDQWYFETMKHVDDFYLNVNVDRELNVTKLWIDVIMYNKKGEKIGMGGTGFSLDKFLNNFIDTKNSYLTPILFDKEGFIQAYKQRDYIQQSAISSDFTNKSKKTIFNLLNEEHRLTKLMELLVVDNQTVKTMNLKINGESRIAALAYIPDIEWYAMILLDSSEIFSLTDFSLVIASLILSLLLIVIAIIYFLNKIVIKPINKLADFSNIIAKGNYKAQIDLKSDNELGFLADSFNQMAQTINEYTDHLEEIVEARTEELTHANHNLEDKNQKIMDSIEYAETIQDSILPRNGDLETGLKEHFVIWKPAGIVGGDFYWFKKVNDGYFIAVVDCTGHSVPGALMTMAANSILNRIIDDKNNRNPSQILQELNMILKKTLNQDKSINRKQRLKQDDGLDIGLCYIPSDQKELIYAGAGIGLFYSHNGEIKRIKPNRQGIGYSRSKNDYKYTSHKVKIKENRVFYLTSDGYLDQDGGKRKKRFGRKRFVEMLEKNCKKELKAQKRIYNNKLKEYMNSREQRDDITLIGFSIK